MMLSRLAESLFWMSRYLERADNTARLVEINLQYLVEAEDAALGPAQWDPILGITGNRELFQQIAGNDPQKTNVVPFLIGEANNPNSIYSSVSLARENARVVRDSLSGEMWESINHLYIWLENLNRASIPLERADPLCNELRRRVAQFHGLTASTMMTGEPYAFYRLGTFLERADMTARILDVKYFILLPDVAKVGSALDYYQWAALLKSLSALEAYRRSYPAGLRPVDVAEFIIFNQDFPRSLFFCAQRLQQALGQVGQDGPHAKAHQALKTLCQSLSSSDAAMVFQSGLHEYLQDVLRMIGAVGAALQSDYFQASLGERFALLD